MTTTDFITKLTEAKINLSQGNAMGELYFEAKQGKAFEAMLDLGQMILGLCQGTGTAQGRLEKGYIGELVEAGLSPEQAVRQLDKHYDRYLELGKEMLKTIPHK